MKKILIIIMHIAIITISNAITPKLEVKPEFKPRRLASEIEVKHHLKLPFIDKNEIYEFCHNFQKLTKIAKLSPNIQIKQQWCAKSGEKASFTALLSNHMNIEINLYAVKSQNEGCNTILSFLVLNRASFIDVIDYYRITKNNSKEYIISYVSQNDNKEEKIIFDLSQRIIFHIRSSNVKKSSEFDKATIQIYSSIINIFNSAEEVKKSDSPKAESKKKPIVKKQDVVKQKDNSKIKGNLTLDDDFYVKQLQELENIKNKSAEDNFAVAQFYYFGRKNINIDKAKAREYYQQTYNQAKNNQDSQSKYIIGMSAIRLGRKNEGIKNVIASADAGYSDAQAELAFLYMKGTYVKRDITKAYEYAKKASDQGDMFGRAILGAYYMNVKKDIKLGIKLIQESAKKGNAGGQYMLYRCLYYGKGVKKDRKKARELLQKAANQGQSDAATKWRLMNGK